LSDHAEAFGEHNELFHTRIFWIEGIRTPTIIYIPKNISKYFTKTQLESLKNNTEKYTENTDIFPTILDFMNISTNKKIDGESLLAPLQKRYIFSTITAADTKFTYIDRFIGVKYTFDTRKNLIYISNIYQDPYETKIKIVETTKKYNRKTAMIFIKNYVEYK